MCVLADCTWCWHNLRQQHTSAIFLVGLGRRGWKLVESRLGAEQQKGAGCSHGFWFCLPWLITDGVGATLLYGRWP
jgi:hypothetical protein